MAESVVCTRSYNKSTNMNFAENSSYEYTVHMAKLSSVLFYFLARPCESRVGWITRREKESK